MKDNERIYDEMFPNGIKIIEILDGKDSHWRVESDDQPNRTHMTLGKAYEDANARCRAEMGEFAA